MYQPTRLRCACTQINGTTEYICMHVSRGTSIFIAGRTNIYCLDNDVAYLRTLQRHYRPASYNKQTVLFEVILSRICRVIATGFHPQFRCPIRYPAVYSQNISPTLCAEFTWANLLALDYLAIVPGNNPPYYTVSKLRRARIELFNQQDFYIRTDVVQLIGSRRVTGLQQLIGLA